MKGMCKPVAKKNSKQVALGGVMGALCIATMLLGSIIPFATFVAPALAGIFIGLMGEEISLPTGLSMYISVSILSLLLVPEKEMAFIFVFFFGFYPLIKPVLQKPHLFIAKVALKLLLFNVCIISMYALLLFIFPIASVVTEFADYSYAFIVGLLLLGNVTFLMYDFALDRLFQVYTQKFRPRFLKGLQK